MQLSAPAAAPVPVAAPVTAPFHMRYYGVDDNSALDVENKLLDLASKHKVGFTDLKIGPAVLESNPPQGNITGNVVGESEAVKQALAALEILDQEV